MRNQIRKPKRPRNKTPKKAVRKVNEKYYTKLDIFLSRIASIIQVPKGQVMKMFNERTITVIRLNPLADSPSKIYSRLVKWGYDLERVPWSPDTYIVRNFDKSELGKSEEFTKGLFYIQNLSSMLPVIILDPKPKEKILDMCAAPGSKTTMISALTRDKADIIALEEDFRRTTKLRAVLNQYNVKNADIKNVDARYIGKELSDYFDKVLLDAPCSGEGQIYLQGEKPLRFWTIKKIKLMSKIQKQLISSAFKSLKPGGTLVYSTCTLEPEENEGVVSYLLNTEPSAFIESVNSLIDSEQFTEYKPLTRKGITHWNSMDFHSEMGKALRVNPSGKMQGFFVVKIGKRYKSA